MIGRTIRNVLPDSVTSMLDENGTTNWHDVGTLKLDAAVLPTVTSYENVDSHTVYHTVWAPSPGEYFTASHRFSAFVELHKAIQVACGLPAAFPVPATLAVTESVESATNAALELNSTLQLTNAGSRWKKLAAVKSMLTSIMTPAEEVRKRHHAEGWETLVLEEQQWSVMDRTLNAEKYDWLAKLAGPRG